MENIGIDILEIDRMNLNINFIRRFLSEEEIKIFQTTETILKKKKFLASRWALKEAIYKALPFEHLVFNKINISKNEYNQPTVNIKDYIIKLSLSYSQTNVVAIAVVFKS